MNFPALEQVRRVLVLKPSSMGDVIHALPAVTLLKKRHPYWEIDWLVNPEWAPLLEDNPHLHAVRIFPRNDFRGALALPKFWNWTSRFAKEHGPYDLAIDFQGLLRSGVIARRAAKATAGLSDAREGSRGLYQRIAMVGDREHAVKRYLRLAVELGVGQDCLEDTGADLQWPLPEGEGIEGIVFPEKFVVLHPFSRGEHKSLSLEAVLGFCRFCQERELPLVLVGRSEEEIAGRTWPEGTLNLLNRTDLKQLITVLRHAALVVSVDSGPMHLATALSPRVVGIHSWTDPVRVGPYRHDATVIKAGRALPMREILQTLPDLGSDPSLPTAADLRKLTLADLMEIS